MRGTSRASLQSVRSRFEPVLAGAGVEALRLGEELFALVDALDSSASLRRTLTDPSVDADAKGALAARLLTAADAFGKVAQLRRELIALGERFLFRLAIHSEVMRQLGSVVIGRIDDQTALRPQDLVGADFLRPEAGPESRQAFLRELQHGGGHFVGLGKPGLAVVGRNGGHFQRLIAEQVAGRVDAINADVI